MSSARQGLSVVGQLVGMYFGGPIGGAIGGAIGGEIGGFIDGPPEGPRLDDLSAPQVEFGGKIPRLYGGPKWFEVGTRWMSEKTEHSDVVGGKGGDSGVEQFSYTVNMLLCVTESREGTPCEVIAVTGVEVDGQLVWTALADAGDEAIANSQEQEIWSDMAVMLGHEDQAPWSVYETSVGAANAIAYRGYLTVGFENFLLADGGMPRRIRIQAITAGTQGETDALTLLQSRFIDSNPDDESAYQRGSPTISATGATIGPGELVITNPDGDPHYVEYSPSGLHANGIDALTFEAIIRNDNSPPVSPGLRFTIGSFDSFSFSWPSNGPPVYLAYDEVGGIGIEGQTSGTVGYLENAHVAVIYTASEIRVYAGPAGGASELIYSAAGAYTVPDDEEITVTFGNSQIGGATGPVCTGFRVRQEEVYTGSTFTCPTEIPPPDASYDTWVPAPVLLRDILEYEAGERCSPLTVADLDFSAAAGITVDCHVGIGSAAETMQPLLTRFWFDLFSADKLILVRRGGSIEQTIPFLWSGAGNGQRAEGFAGLIRSNDVEVAKKKAVTYSNMLADGETDTRTGDRESVGTDVDTVSMNLNIIPSEAQGLADTMTWDARIAGHTASITVGARHGLLLQPGSVFTGVDHHGNTYRLLARRIVWDRWVWTVDVRLDDPTVLQASGIAVDLDQRALTVPTPPVATLYVLDIPLLRIEDDSPGEYVAVTQVGRWRGAAIWKSSDDVTYTHVTDVSNKAIAGDCDSALPAFSGWGWDNSSVLTVTLDDGAGGTLTSATKTAIEASRSLNLAAVGVHGRWELLQFATATLLTGSTYELRGFLRNLFGTEWASDEHTLADSFVLLTPALGRVPGAVSDLGQTRYYKAVPMGRSAGGVEASSIVCEEQCLLPYAPVDLHNDADTIRWNRRSRIEGAIGLEPPLGEASERYDAEVYTGATLDESETVTTNEWTPASDPSGKTAKVYQLSELVGRGHEAEAELS